MTEPPKRTNRPATKGDVMLGCIGCANFILAGMDRYQGDAWSTLNLWVGIGCIVMLIVRGYVNIDW
jgi:hypothetical protein